MSLAIRQAVSRAFSAFGAGSPAWYGEGAEYINYATLYATPSDIGTVWTGGSGAGGMIVTDTDWTNFLTAAASGNITGVVATSHSLTLPKTITTTPSSQVMIRGESSVSKAVMCSSSAGVMGAFTFGSTSSNWTLKWLTLGHASSTSGRCLSLTGTAHDNINVYECEFFGSTLDPYGAYTGGAPTTVFAGGQDGGSYFVNHIFAGNYVHDVNSGLGAGGTSSGVLFNNTFDKTWTDPVNLTVTSSNSIKCLFNKFSRFIGLATDTGNPHVDAIQIVSNTTDVFDAEIIGNVIFNGNSRASAQAIFANGTSGYYSRFKIAGNLIVTDNTLPPSYHYITIDRIKDLFVFGNISVTRTPGSGSGATGFRLGTEVSSGKSLLSGNITDGGSVTYGVQKVSNNELSHSLAQYQSVMSWASDPTTVAECITAAARTVALTSYVDYTNYKLRVSDEPGWIPLVSEINNPTSTLETSNIAKLIGGKASQTISVTGGEYQVSSDSAGSSVVTAWTSASGTIARGNYVQVRHTTSASEVTTTTTTLTIGGYANTWTTTTLDTSVFTYVTAAGGVDGNYSTGGASLPTTTYTQMIFAFKVNSSSAVNQYLFSATSNPTNQYIQFNPGTAMLWQFVNSSTIKIATQAGTLGQDTTVILSMDFGYNSTSYPNLTTAERFELGVKCMINNVQNVLTVNSWNPASSYALSIIPGTLRLLGRLGSTTSTFTGQFHFFWFAGFNGDMPDITDPEFSSKFSAQVLSNTDGSFSYNGSTITPLLYYGSNDATPSLTKAAAGTTNNKGSLGVTTATTLTNGGTNSPTYT